MEQTILTRLLEITIYSTVLFLIVWLFRSVFTKLLSPQLKYALWFLVVLRLCLPVTLESGLHLYTADTTPCAYRNKHNACDARASRRFCCTAS